MKLDKAFNGFLENVVNLNKTRFDTAESGMATMTSILENDEVFGKFFIDVKPQGSFRQETIIKPVDARDFDVDLLFEMEFVDGWEPKDYLLNLSSQLRKIPRYEKLVDTRGKTRCVTIDYESDFHIDIVPTIQTASGGVIFNKETNQVEPTDGDGYAQWFDEKNKITGKKLLVKVVRLIKYIRDADKKFEAKSILLTTLLGNQVFRDDKREDLYPDLPTAFVVILSRLDNFLQANPVMPEVKNPVLPTEPSFNRKWDQKKYEKFRDSVHEYSLYAIDAFKEPDEYASLKKWQKVFGEKFVLSGAENSREIVFPCGFVLGDSSHKHDLTTADIVDYGNYTVPVKIQAGLYWGRQEDKEVNRRYIRPFSSGSELPISHWLKYEIAGDIPYGYEIYWQVVNTGAHAREKRLEGGLRGEIRRGELKKWERSLYTGVHWVECLIVNPSSRQCVGRSGPFFVVFNNPNFLFRP